MSSQYGREGGGGGAPAPAGRSRERRRRSLCSRRGRRSGAGREGRGVSD